MRWPLRDNGMAATGGEPISVSPFDDDALAPIAASPRGELTGGFDRKRAIGAVYPRHDIMNAQYNRAAWCNRQRWPCGLQARSRMLMLDRRDHRVGENDAQG